MSLTGQDNCRPPRLAQFLREQYPELIQPGQQIQAGSAAVQELAKIHGVAPAEADALAARVIGGEIGVIELARRFELLQRQPGGPAPLTRKYSSQRASAFTDMAAKLILSGSVKLPTELGVVQVMRPDRREPMAPDLIAFGKEPGQVIAVEIKAHSDRSARSTFQTATELMERMGLLKLHFYDAVLVLPKDAGELAQLAQERWDAWVKNLPAQTRKMPIMLIDTD